MLSHVVPSALEKNHSLSGLMKCSQLTAALNLKTAV